MKRFPDIIVISWQCDCGAYMSQSIDVPNVTFGTICRDCGRVYTLAIGDLDVPISVIPPRASDTQPQDGIPV